MGSTEFCQLLMELRRAASGLPSAALTLHALAQLAVALEGAEVRGGSKPHAGDPASA